LPVSFHGIAAELLDDEHYRLFAWQLGFKVEKIALSEGQIIGRPQGFPEYCLDLGSVQLFKNELRLVCALMSFDETVFGEIEQRIDALDSTSVGTALEIKGNSIVTTLQAGVCR